jgi:hypothetical protein
MSLAVIVMFAISPTITVLLLAVVIAIYLMTKKVRSAAFLLERTGAR